MPVSAAHAERAKELQQRYPFYTKLNIAQLMEMEDLEEQDARERKPQDPKPALK